MPCSEQVVRKRVSRGLATLRANLKIGDDGPVCNPARRARQRGSRTRAGRAPAPRRWWERLAGRLGWRSHPLAIVLGTLVVSGSATAGVIALTSSSSQPLAGNVPGTVEPASLAGSATPSRSPRTSPPARRSGTRRSRTARTAGSAPAREADPCTRRARTHCSAGVGVTGGSTPPRGDTVGYVMTAPYVVAVRVGDRTIRTFSSPDLPAGDRAAVLFLPAGYPNLVLGWRPGQPIRSHETFPLPGQRPLRIHTIAASPDRSQWERDRDRISDPVQPVPKVLAGAERGHAEHQRASLPRTDPSASGGMRAGAARHARAHA